MTRQRRLAIVISSAGIALSLIGIGIGTGSDWSSLVPDILIGVGGASIIAIAVFYATERAADRRIRAADVTAAYNRLLDELAGMRQFDFRRNDFGKFGDVVTRMMQLADTVDDDNMRTWFEAERQRGLYRAAETMKRVDALPPGPSDPEAHFAANSPFLEWVAEMSHNVRHWRVNGGDLKQMVEHAIAIEKKLREMGAWRDEALPWATEGVTNL